MAGALAVVLEAGDVPDGGVQPYVEILAGFSRNLEAEVGCIPADVPLLQSRLGPLPQFIGYLGLQSVRIKPGFQHVRQFGKLEEKVGRFLLHRFGAGDRGNRVDQVRRAVGGAAGLAVVPVLVGCFAARAAALDESVGEEQLLFRVEGLGDRPGGYMVVGFQAPVNLLTPVAVFLRVGGVEVVESDQEARAVPLVLLPDRVDLLLRAYAQLFRREHDGGAVGIVGAYVQAVVAAGFLETDPDVRLDLLEQMSQVQRTIGVG